MRQYSTFHPEFSYLPRKFKIAMTGATHDRAAVAFHDIGVRLVKNEQGDIGCQVIVGGGLGRTPVIGEVIHPCLEKKHLLSYIEAIVRVYNLHGNRDNKFKARIKILVRELGIESFAAKSRKNGHIFVMEPCKFLTKRSLASSPFSRILPTRAMPPKIGRLKRLLWKTKLLRVG